ncbi:MAG: zinc-binding dehydrogenase [Planctomycetes bacterium]|nr:zinc-binding dehydrogenase [Planctomycetota bacterium]
MRRVAAIDGRGQFAVIEEPIPEPKPGQVLIEVAASLISPGTELGGVPARRKNPTDAPPRPFGYQNGGTIIKLGEGVTRFMVGDRVATMGGGFALHASHTVAPVNLTVPIPEGVSFEEAAFCHLAATALHCIRRAEPQFGENFAICGLGVVGQLCVQFAKLSGTHVAGLDRFPKRLDIAKATGADAAFNVAEGNPVPRVAEFCRGHGLDCGILAFGGEATEAARQLYEMMRPAPDGHRWGRIVAVGGARVTLGLAADLGNVAIRSSARPGPGYHDDAWEHGADYPPVFVPWTTQRNLEESLRAIAEGTLRVKPLITDIVPLAQAPAACEKLVSSPGEAIGVILKP